jgi:hypothetical protein
MFILVYSLSHYHNKRRLFPEVDLAVFTLEYGRSWYLAVRYKGLNPWIMAVYWYDINFHNI